MIKILDVNLILKNCICPHAFKEFACKKLENLFSKAHMQTLVFDLKLPEWAGFGWTYLQYRNADQTTWLPL